MAVATTAVGVRAEPAVALPEVPLPQAPRGGLVWNRALTVVAVLMGLFALDRLALLLMQLWFMNSLGYSSVFWKNFRVGAFLFVFALVRYAAIIAVPAFVLGADRATKRIAIKVGVLVGLVFAFLEARHYPDYLLFYYGKHWGQADPIFHHDLGFYVFRFPAIHHTLYDAWRVSVVGLISAVTWAAVTPAPEAANPAAGRPARLIARLATPFTLWSLTAVGLTMAADDWLRRYGLLFKNNAGKGIPTGASNLDAAGIFSTAHAIVVEAVVVAAATLALVYRLHAVRRSVLHPEKRSGPPRLRARWVLAVLIPAIALDFSMKAMVGLRNVTTTAPNEPLIQLPYITDHIKLTNQAYGLTNVNIAQFTPGALGDPKPNVATLVHDPAIAQAPMWGGSTVWMKRVPDPAHLNRNFMQNPPIDGKVDSTVAAPTLFTYQQQQKLRPYYNFLNTRTVRYFVRDPKNPGAPPTEKIFATSVRELPLIEPKPWLAWWGQRFVIFTHGWGFVANEASQSTTNGEPVYATSNIPIQTTNPELSVQQPGIYYGEGSGSMAYSNLHGIQEHNFPTDNGRSQTTYPPGIKAGVTIDSWLKRIVFGYKSGSFLDIFFSRLIRPHSRVHYYRQPLDRLSKIAPFLYWDGAPFAVTGGERVQWMLNGMTTSATFPYSRYTQLGDTTGENNFMAIKTRKVNYAHDAVKATVDAYTGQVHLYKWTNDDPVLNTYAAMYPKLFAPKAAMPAPLAQQVQYPQSLFHAQMADVWRYTHMTNPLTFYTREDKYDQANQVLGPNLTEGKAIVFPLEPYYWLATPGRNGLAPSSASQQFSLSMAFTPSGNSQNLRALATVYMDGPDYGKISFTEIPKGHYFEGPEQADSAIDQDPFISQQTHLWERRGLQIIRGQMLPLVDNGELIYVEPWFVRSLQNPLPRLRRVMVVYRGTPTMEATLPTAVNYAVHPFHQFPTRGGPELGGEPVFIHCTKSYCPRL